MQGGKKFKSILGIEYCGTYYWTLDALLVIVGFTLVFKFGNNILFKWLIYRSAAIPLE